jgi:hypothetical protein
MTAHAANSVSSNRLIKPIGIAALVIAFGISFLLGTDGFQTYLSKERRLVEAGEVLAKALRIYRDASPGSAKDFPTELADLLHDPRMLADKGYLTTLPVDPLTQKQEWGVIRNKINQVIGVHSLSNESPTIYAKILSFRGEAEYSD